MALFSGLFGCFLGGFSRLLQSPSTRRTGQTQGPMKEGLDPKKEGPTLHLLKDRPIPNHEKERLFPTPRTQGQLSSRRANPQEGHSNQEGRAKNHHHEKDGRPQEGRANPEPQEGRANIPHPETERPMPTRRAKGQPPLRRTLRPQPPFFV